MKNGKSPTVRQMKLMQEQGLNPENWLVVKDKPDQMELVNRHNVQTRRIIPK